MRSLALALLVAHIIAGTAAVLVGLVALVAPKPVGRRAPAHLRSGRLFLYAMAVVIGTSVALTLISFNPYFAGLTAAATVAVFSGYRVLGRKRPDVNTSHRARPLDWIVTLLILAVGVFLTGLAATGRVTQNLPVVYSLGAGSTAYALYDLYRFARPAGFPFTPNLWLYEHLVKMIGGYFGAVAAFSGSVLILLPPPWRQLWATTLGQTLAVVFVLYYRRRLKGANARRAATVNAGTAADVK
ncbi:MAG TPA: hypothetical protein VK421_19920 [Pyrinomonadaceae bacterium]|nr:hypothetical protein [Pyrinomonadaceae bacterium]